MRTMPPKPERERTSALYLWRHAKKWTQKELAHELGVGVATVQRLEALPSLPTKYQLAFDALRAKHDRKK